MVLVDNLNYGDLEMEKWKDIEGFEGLYQIGQNRRIRCIRHCRRNDLGEIISASCSYPAVSDMTKTRKVQLTDSAGNRRTLKVLDVFNRYFKPLDVMYEELEKENKQLRECVEFYADGKNWRDRDYPCNDVIVDDLTDENFPSGGKKARRCLEKTL